MKGEDAGDFAVVVGKQTTGGSAVEDGTAESADFTAEPAFDVFAVHGEVQGLVGGVQVAAFVVAVFIQGKKVAGLAVGVFFQVLDDGKGVSAEDIGAFLVDDAFSDLGQRLDHVFRSSISGDGDDIEGVHASADGAEVSMGPLSTTTTRQLGLVSLALMAAKVPALPPPRTMTSASIFFTLMTILTSRKIRG